MTHPCLAKRPIGAAILAAVALVAPVGCTSKSTDDITIIEQYVTVLDRQGQQRTIPVGDLQLHQNEDAQFSKVLTVDRRTGRQAWIAFEHIGTGPPSQARFVPITRDGPGVAE